MVNDYITPYVVKPPSKGIGMLRVNREQSSSYACTEYASTDRHGTY